MYRASTFFFFRGKGYLLYKDKVAFCIKRFACFFLNRIITKWYSSAGVNLNCSLSIISPHLKENGLGFISQSTKIERWGKVFEIILILFKIKSAASNFLLASNKQRSRARVLGRRKGFFFSPLNAHTTNSNSMTHTVYFLRTFYFIILRLLIFFFFFEHWLH